MGNRNISLYDCEVEKDNSQSRESTCDMVLVTQQWDSYGHNLLYNRLSLANYLSLLLRPMDPEPCPTHQQRPDFCGASSQKSILRRNLFWSCHLSGVLMPFCTQGPPCGQVKVGDFLHLHVPCWPAMHQIGLLHAEEEDGGFTF